MTLPNKILIAYDVFPPIAYDLAAAFQRLGIETRLFIASEHEHWFYKHAIKRLNKLARNLRLVKKGHDVFLNHPLNRLPYLASQYQKLAGQYQPDFVFSIHGQPFGNEIFSKLNVPKIAWWTEPNEKIADLRRYAAPFDQYLSFSFAAEELLKAEGFNTGFLNHAASPDRFYPMSDQPRIFDIAFVGNWSPWREEVINKTLSITRNIALYGPNWKKKSKLAKSDFAHIYKGEKIVGEKLNGLFNSAKIILNSNRFKESSGLNMRFFEVLAARACFLTDPAPELLTFFTPGEHLCTYADTDQLAEQIRTLLADNKLCARIRDCGYQHVMQNHTYDNMAQTLLALYADINTNYGKPCLKPYSMA